MKNSDLKVFCLIIIILLLLCGIVPFLLGEVLLGEPSREELLVSTSPSGEYTVVAYRINAGATVDYSVEVCLQIENSERKIYNAYHEREVKIVWIDNTTVSINGKTLDLSRGETYDWRTQ